MWHQNRWCCYKSTRSMPERSANHGLSLRSWQNAAVIATSTRNAMDAASRVCKSKGSIRIFRLLICLICLWAYRLPKLTKKNTWCSAKVKSWSFLLCWDSLVGFSGTFLEGWPLPFWSFCQRFASRTEVAETFQDGSTINLGKVKNPSMVLYGTSWIHWDPAAFMKRASYSGHRLVE